MTRCKQSNPTAPEPLFMLKCSRQNLYSYRNICEAQL